MLMPHALPLLRSRRGAGVALAAALTAALGLGLTGSAQLPAAQATTATCPSAGGATQPMPAMPYSSQMMLIGHGWGHSLGMSQYGAQGAALLGCSASQILSTYYTGTKLVAPTLATHVYLTLLTNGSSATVHSLTGDMTWVNETTLGTFTQHTGKTWTVTRSGTGAVVKNSLGDVMWTMKVGQHIHAGEHGLVATVAGSGGSALPAFETRWDYTDFVLTSSGLQMDQVLTNDSHGTAVQKYLWGIGEVPSSWPAQALEAQAIAARTYLAARYNSTYGGYVIGTTSATQVNTGYAHEAADASAGGRWKAAVNATPNQVLETSSGSLITAMFTSSVGGHSEDYAYVYGGSGVSYLHGIDDSRWDLASSDPNRTWVSGYTWADLAAKFGMQSVASVRLAPQGSSARDAGATVSGTIDGTLVTKTYSGSALKSIFGVLSPGLTFQLPPQPLVGDFNGDGKTDVGWFYKNEVDLLVGGKRITYHLGIKDDVAVVGDWTGDGKDDIGVFRQGQWYLCTAMTGSCGSGFHYGAAGDIPVVGHWPGTTKDSIGVVRGNRWLLRDAPTPGPITTQFTFGSPTDTPLVGDWTGDGFDTPGRRAGQTWYWTNTLVPSTVSSRVYGSTTDVPIPGDWDGNKTDTFGVARDGSSFLLRNDNLAGTATTTVTFAPSLK
jgi:stage II sporulation protein D